MIYFLCWLIHTSVKVPVIRSLINRVNLVIRSLQKHVAIKLFFTSILFSVCLCIIGGWIT